MECAGSGLASAYPERRLQGGHMIAPADADVARMSALATPNLPADTDLYLQRQLADGTWSDDLSTGTSGSLTEETLDTTRLPAGSRYRVEAHRGQARPGRRSRWGSRSTTPQA